MLPFNFHGHTVMYDPSTWGEAAFKCDCAVPLVVAAGICFMVEQGIQSLVVDGVEIRRGTA